MADQLRGQTCAEDSTPNHVVTIDVARRSSSSTRNSIQVVVVVAIAVVVVVVVVAMAVILSIIKD